MSFASSITFARPPRTRNCADPRSPPIALRECVTSRLATTSTAPTQRTSLPRPLCRALGGRCQGRGTLGGRAKDGTGEGAIAIGVEALLDDLNPTRGDLRARRQKVSNESPAAASVVNDFTEVADDQYVLCRRLE